MSFEVVTIRDCTLYREDCLEVLPTLAPDSVDSIVTDPPYGLGFMGSGSTAKAAIKEGFRFVGIEREQEYFAIACQRAKAEFDKTALIDTIPAAELPKQGDLFASEASR